MALAALSFGVSILLGVALLWAWRSRGDALRALGAKQLECEQLQQELDKCQHRFEEFKGTLLHDLRGPLQSVTGYSDLLASDATGPLNPKQKRFLENIRSSTPKILDIIDREQADCGKQPW